MEPRIEQAAEPWWRTVSPYARDFVPQPEHRCPLHSGSAHECRSRAAPVTTGCYPSIEMLSKSRVCMHATPTPVWYGDCYLSRREQKAPRSFPCGCAGVRKFLFSAATFAPLQALIPSFIRLLSVSRCCFRHGKDRAKARSFYKMGALGGFRHGAPTWSRTLSGIPASA